MHTCGCVRPKVCGCGCVRMWMCVHVWVWVRALGGGGLIKQGEGTCKRKQWMGAMSGQLHWITIEDDALCYECQLLRFL